MLLPGTFVNSIARGGVARDHRLAIVAILIFISLYKDWRFDWSIGVQSDIFKNTPRRLPFLKRKQMVGAKHVI
jgi:hypothetical protein